MGDDEDMQQLSEAIGAAKIRVDGCSSFLKAAIRFDPELEFLSFLASYFAIFFIFFIL